MVRYLQGRPCIQGSPVKLGEAIRLQHSGTHKWLHSHHFTSPLTGNQEVSPSAVLESYRE